MVLRFCRTGAKLSKLSAKAAMLDLHTSDVVGLIGDDGPDERDDLIDDVFGIEEPGEDADVLGGHALELLLIIYQKLGVIR